MEFAVKYLPYWQGYLIEILDDSGKVIDRKGQYFTKVEAQKEGEKLLRDWEKSDWERVELPDLTGEESN